MSAPHRSTSFPSVTDSSYGQGISLVAIGGLVLSVDIPLIRLSESAFWTVLFVRGVLTFLAAVVVWRIDRRIFRHEKRLIAGRMGFWVTGIFSVGAITFVVAVFNTSAGNVVFILAFNPMFAATLSYFLMGEIPSRATLAAIPATIFGVLLIIGAGLETGNWLGDLAALATAGMTALGITLSRRSRTDMRYAAALGVLLPGIIALPFVASEGIRSDAIGWLVLNGALVIPVAMICLASAPMYVPAPLVSMGYLIETVLAPVWVWLVFGERPIDLALIGGAIVVLTLITHATVEFMNSRRRQRRR